MLKSLFEASIDKLNIPVEMKSAIKDINKICLEAEGDENDKGYTPMSKEDIEKGKKLQEEEKKKRVNEDYKYEAYPKASQQQAAPAQQNTQNVETNVDNAKDANDAWNILKNLQQKAVKSRGTQEGEKWRQMLETEYDKALKKNLVQRTKGIEMTIYNKGNQQAQNNAEPAAEPKKEEKPFNNLTAEEAKNMYTVQQNQGGNDAGTQAAPEQNGGQQTAQGTSEETSQAASNTAQQPAQSENKGEQQAQNNAKPAAPQYRKGADVATVQFFLRAKHPDSNIVGDGVLGPKTIKLIQETEKLNPTGKMDKDTQEAFNLLLNEAKKQVKAVQEKLGVTQDGLIGKQTLDAMNKANMNVANIFGGKPQNTNVAKANTNGNNKEPVKTNTFNAQDAQRLLASNNISQKEYNIWKIYGIAPVDQRSNPRGTQTQIAKAQQAKKNEAQAGSRPTENVQPQNEEEKKFFDKMKENYLKVYTVSAQQKGKSEGWANNMAQHAAEEALTKKRNGTWGKTQPQANQQQAVAQGNPKQAQPAKQTQQAAAAPQNNQNSQGNNEVYKRTQDAKGTTEYYSGNLSLYNLSKEEEKLRDQAEEKEKAKYFDGDKIKINPNTKKPYNEESVLRKIDEAGRNAIVQYRMAKARARQG